MGRKIPGKKHKGVKDPDKQRAIRFNSVKDKINAPPTNPDEQYIPKSLQEFMNIKERYKNPDALKRKHKNKRSKLIVIDKPHKSDKTKIKRLTKSGEATPLFNQNPGESNRVFLNRVNRMVQDVIKESQFETKYNVKVQRNTETGEVEDVVKLPKDKVEKMMSDAAASKKNNKKKKKTKEPRLTKSQKKQIKLAEKKEHRQLRKTDEFDNYKDSIKFGETVDCPPTLITPKKVIKNNFAPRPGKKDLLLKSVLKENQQKPSVKFPPSSKKTIFQKIENAKIDKTGKRKNLPVAVRRQLDTQRNEIVNAYRMLQQKKTKIEI